jgi:ribosome maturation factor RimP
MPVAVYEWAVHQPFFFEGMKDLVDITRQALAGMELELVTVDRAPMGLLRITIDCDTGVTIEHCEGVSKQLSRVYEVEGIDYRRLEVGSPGVDRPLRTERDFQRFLGERIELKLREAVDDQKVFKGVLHLAAVHQEPGGAVLFDLEYQVKKGDVRRVTFSISDVDRAKLDPLLDFKGRKR